jgi:hypothetical protein
MAENDRVDYVTNDLGAGQQAPAQANRTEFYPGKATSREGDMNWEKDSRIPQGTPAFDGEAVGPVEMERSRVVKLHRNTVCDQTIPAPTVLSTKVEAVTTDSVCGTHEVDETETIDTPVEKLSGYDNIKGA